MNIDQWWPKLDTTTQEWLIEHNGEPVSVEVLGAIMSANGISDDNARWLGEVEPGGVCLSDENVDWIAATANGELPAATGPG
ncbi:hypothetical protein [Tomitella biformata]|uniref:hypothetical protein n=1 Tax=Tomitella biformata TaxID=630403 RepID=UPI000463A1A5|nr:hypothetical protein [Tomitella biformata]